MVENNRELEKAIKEVLGNAPKVRGYTLRELRENVTTPWPTSRWHLELAQYYEPGEHAEIGSAYKKLEALRKKSKTS